MKYGQISMNSDRGALWIIINFCPPPALLPHSSAPAGTPVASHGPPAGVAAPPSSLAAPLFHPPAGSASLLRAPRAPGSGDGSGTHRLPLEEAVRMALSRKK